MGYLVSIIGSSGVGKTTLADKLAEQAGFFDAKEDLTQRPFQAAFSEDLKRYALANQVDFLLYRAEQERNVRRQNGIGVQDGGLDLDYYLFTRLFHVLGYLSDGEFDLCHRLYTQLRSLRSGPELYLYLEAPIEVISSRYAKRKRGREIARLQDLETMQKLLDRWLATLDSSHLLTIDACDSEYTSEEGVNHLAELVKEFYQGRKFAAAASKS